MYAASLPAGIGLMPYPIYSNDGQAVGHGMTALHELPGLALAGLFLRGVAALVTDSGGIDEDVGSGKGHQAGTFRIPLIPADLYAKTANGGLDGMETEVARSEVELLVVGRVVGDVHLTLYASDAAVALEDDGGIVVETWRTALEEACDENDRMFAGKGSKEIGGGSRDGFCEVEVVDGFDLAEIGGIVKLLKDYKFSTTRGDVGNRGGEASAVVFGVSGARLLDEGGDHMV